MCGTSGIAAQDSAQFRCSIGGDYGRCGDWADLNRKGTGTVCLMQEFMNSCRGL